MNKIPMWAMVAGAIVLLGLAILIGMRAVKSTDNGSFVAPTDPNRYQKEMQKRSGSYGAPNGGQPGQGGGAPGGYGRPGAPGGGGAPSGYGRPSGYGAPAGAPGGGAPSGYGAPGGSGAPYGGR